jgi:hypothetical protein
MSALERGIADHGGIVIKNESRVESEERPLNCLLELRDEYRNLRSFVQDEFLSGIS